MWSEGSAVVCRTLLALSVLALPAVAAAEPRVAFTVEDGWLRFAVRQDDKPVADAAVSVFTEQGAPWAKGETGDNGKGGFPLPRGDEVLVELKLGEKTADLITLRRTGDGVEPAEVLVTFGLRPCCRVPSRGGVYQPGPDVSPASSGRWLAWTVMSGCLLVGGSLVVLALRGRGQ